MNPINLEGMGVALITPFKEDQSVDYESLSRMLDFQLENGTDYLVVLGTTAETPALTVSEQSEIVKFIVSWVKGRVPIVLGVGGNCTTAVVEKLNEWKSYTGIDAILSVTPYYNRPTQEGLYQHYKAIAQATELPVILYNVPGRTGVNMTAETTLRLAFDFENIVAIKEASGMISQIDEIIRKRPAGFHVISGDDSLTLPLIGLGAIGVISVLGNAFPKEFLRLVHLALSGSYVEALNIHRSFAEIIELLFVDGNPSGVKSALACMGLVKNTVRLPLVPVRTVTHEKIIRAVMEFKQSFQ